MNQIFLYYFIKKDKKLNQLRGCPGSSCGTTVENTPRDREDVSSNPAGSGPFYSSTLCSSSGASLNRSHAEVQHPWFSFQLCLSSLKRSKRWYGLSKRTSEVVKAGKLGSEKWWLAVSRNSSRDETRLHFHSFQINFDSKEKKCSAEKSVFPTKEKFFRVHEDFFKNSLIETNECL